MLARADDGGRRCPRPGRQCLIRFRRQCHAGERTAAPRVPAMRRSVQGGHDYPRTTTSVPARIDALDYGAALRAALRYWIPAVIEDARREAVVGGAGRGHQSRLISELMSFKETVEEFCQNRFPAALR